MKLRPVLRALLLASSLALPAGAFAQGTTLTITGLPLTFSTPTGADFFAQSIASSNLTTYTVAASATGANAQRSATVSVRALTLTGNATLQWKTPTGSWTTLTTSNVDVETFILRKGESASNTLQWRYVLDWTTTTPGSNSASIAFTLSVTVQ